MLAFDPVSGTGNSINVYCGQLGLTVIRGAAILCASPHWDTGSRNLVFRTGVKTPSQGVFLCPSFSTAIGCAFRYGGVIWAAFGAGRTCSRFSTPLHAAAHDVEIIGGGLVTLEQEYPL